MGRLIDATAFHNYLEMMQEANKDKHKDYVYYLGYAIAHLNDFTEVEGIEIVRCKECKHYMTIHCTCDGCCISDNWYCADGERKDND